MAIKQGLSSRLCAFHALTAVLDQKKPLDQALDKFTAKYDLSPQDRSFAHALCGFVLRYHGDLTRIVQAAADRKTPLTPFAVHLIALMGAAQILLMAVADHAAVDSAVGLAHQVRCPKQAGLINAILRRILREDKPDLAPSLPDWLIKTWEADYGRDTAKAMEQASLIEAPIGLSHKGGTWRALEGDLALSPDEWVQDYASALPVRLLPEDLTGQAVLDLCAAPGGKTMQLAAKGATVTAVDLSEKRLRRLQENLDRTGLQDRVAVICADLFKWQPQDQADIILLDTPCSATGTIRRHPDLPHIRSVKDIQDLTKLQTQMLDRVKDWVKPGGILAYCTCSLQKDEGERQVETFLKDNSNWISIPSPHPLDGIPETGNHSIRLLPSEGNRDGFFIAFLRKQAQ